MSQAFDRLSPALQYQIVNALGFNGLRPVQEHAVPAILDGKNCVVLAPTAGGKTEAAFFPLLSRMDTEQWAPTSVVYVSPIRALINNQAARVERYAGLLARRSALRHGDVSQADRKAFIRNPADILLTTPESLEVMLMSARVPAAEIFRGLQAVVIDEIHAFVGDDRGSHLAAVLERLSRVAGRDIQRIGLSATVGNPEAILKWIAGSSQRDGEVVDPGGGGHAPELALDYVGTLDNAAKVVSQLHRGKKRLVFVDSRRNVEALGKTLRELGTETFLLHSSLSQDERQRTESAFAEGSNRVIVSTSALELGVDIGDLDHVLQIDAPSTVAGFMQRLGRTGRRPGTVANCTFLATSPPALIQAAALIRLYRQGYVEPVGTPGNAAHILAHQVMALSFQQGSIPAAGWFGWLDGASAFADLTAEDRSEVVQHMLENGILAESAARYAMGPRGEKLYGRHNFMELYAVFSTPSILAVMWGGTEVGTLESGFVFQQEIPGLTFTLAGRSWHAKSVDWRRRRLFVEPAAQGKVPKWRGRPKLVGRALCQSLREVVTSEDHDPEWTRRASEAIDGAREGFGFVPTEGVPVVGHEDGSISIWTFAGGRANNLLARCLTSELGHDVSVTNISLKVNPVDDGLVAVTSAMERLRDAGRPNQADADRVAEDCARVKLSKFQPCLPPRLEARFLADELTSPEEARAVLAETVVRVG